MLDRLGSLIEELQRCVGGLDAADLDGDTAMVLCGRFAEVERLGAAGRLVTAERVKATEVWRRGGCRSSADWVARQTGGDPGQARDGLETAGRLSACPVVAGELRAGRLSEAQAQAIVDATAVRPDAEGRLVVFARANSLRRLRLECRRVKNADLSAAEEYRKLHASRSLKTWVGRDGAACGSFRFTGDVGAAFFAAIEERKAQHVKAARRDGRREPFEVYAADALVELVTEERGGEAVGSSRPKTAVIVHVDYETIARGAVADGEMCEITGIGPVPLEAVRRLAADSILRILVSKGGQPMAVSPGVRTIPRALRLLLEARDPTCVVPGCDVSQGLEVDHILGFALLGPTDLENCCRLCPVHHDMKTYFGWSVGRASDGSWTFTPPGDDRDPEPFDPAIGEIVFVNPWTGRPGSGTAEPGGAARSPQGDLTGPAAARGRDGGRAGQLSLAGAAGTGPAP